MTSKKSRDDKQKLIEKDFIKCKSENKYCSIGNCWQLLETIGKGEYWEYRQKNLYNIKIHNFYYNKDQIIEINRPECLSITYYESISGEQLLPYKRLEANCLKVFLGEDRKFKANIHKKIPICSIGIEISPKYYEAYLIKNYPGEDCSLFDAFNSINESEDFPRMVMLLTQIKNYCGEGIYAKLFYDAKIVELVALVIEHQRRKNKDKEVRLSNNDKELIMSVTAYINDHYAYHVKQKHLAQIACMGTTKLKENFKRLHGCTITEYIQDRRMSQAEHLLSFTEFTIKQIAEAVGYKSASRFSELFRKSTGVLPSEYRRILKA